MRRHRFANPRKLVGADIEATAGCGVVPFRYREQSYVNALQWAIGLEIFLLVKNPWQVVLTTDHPNGGPFTSYPHLIRLLMDRSFREEQLSRVHPDVAANCALRSIARELTLDEIAIMTRAAPARLLGLRDRGHLGVGAAADIAVYRDEPNREAMFATPAVRVQGRHAGRACRAHHRHAGGRHAFCRARLRRCDREDAAPPLERARLDRLRSGGHRPRRAVPLLQRRPAAADGLLRGRLMTPVGAAVHNGVTVDDTFAEAFPMKATRLLITAHTLEWARHAAQAATGFATSVIGCGCEAGIEARSTLRPDARRPPGHRAAVVRDVGQGAHQADRAPCRPMRADLPDHGRVLPASPEGEAVALGKNLRFFGDGWQISKVIAGVRYWRVPVMDGEFVAQETTAIVKGVGGGNLLLLARDTDSALLAATSAVEAMRRLPNVIMPFPGGVVRSGSKVGSKYASLGASTNDAFCPGLYGLVDSELGTDTRCVLEIVIDGLSEADVAAAMRAGLQAGIGLGQARGLLRISAGNYGGKLGPFHFHLHKLLEGIRP